MRKMFGKLTAMALSLMLVLGTVTLPVSAEGTFAVSATGTTRIEGEDFTSSDRPGLVAGALNSGANGAILLWDAPGNTNVYTATYPLTVAESGYYTVTAAGSLNDNGGLYSQWGFYANTSTNSANVQSAQDNKFQIYGLGGSTGDIYYCGAVYLEEGENTLYWWFKRATKTAVYNGETKYYIRVALDYVELTPHTAANVSATETTRIEGEQFDTLGHSSVSAVGFGNKRNGIKIDTAAASSATCTISYKLNAAFAGKYSLKAAASDRDNSGLSAWTIYVNDASNAPASYTSENSKFYIGGWGSNTGDVFDCGEIDLSAGENTLYFKFGTTSSKLRAALDYVELTPAFTVTTVSTSAVTKIEGEDASSIVGGGYTRTSVTGCSGEKALSYSPVTWTDGTEYISGFYLSVPEAGYYKIDAVASIRSQTYTSDWYMYANTSENTVSGYTQGAAVSTTWYSGNIKKFNCGKIYLNEGANTIYWKLNESDHPDGKMQAALDYIELTPVLVEITGATISSGTFTATVSKNRALPADANIYLAVYDDSTLDSVKSVYVIDAGTAIGNISVSQALSLSSGNVVRLYVWYDEDHTPLCSPARVN